MKILFRPITLEAQADIIRYTRVGAYRNCDFSFANMYSWQFIYHSEYAVVEDTLFVRFYIDGGRPAYMMPQGAMPLRESIAWLVDDAASLGHTLCLLGISEEGYLYIQVATTGADSRRRITLREKDGGRHQTFTVENEDLVQAETINELRVR